MKLLFRFLITSALVAFSFLPSSQAGEPCGPFRVHRSAPLPPKPDSNPGYSETELLARMSAIEGQETFPYVYQRWLQAHGSEPTKAERQNLLACLYHYSRMDNDRDGKPDWTAIVDGHLSTTLYPADEDLDQDGTPNILDPNPMDPSVRGADSSDNRQVPQHLKMSGARAKLQGELFRSYGLLAIDHTDEHSSVVLRELLTLLEKGFPKGFFRRLPNLKYIYASYAHDPEVDIAGYHFEAKAITIGGKESYPETALSLHDRMNLLSSLAHEIGHAFFLSQIPLEEAKTIAVSLGGWGKILNSKNATTFFDPVFFVPHPSSQLKDYSDEKFPTRYATTNVHEWFADSFVAYVLNGLARDRRFAGKDWKASMAKVMKPSWITSDFKTRPFYAWLHTKMNPPETRESLP